MLNLHLPLPCLIAAGYLFPTAVALGLWYYWDKISLKTNLQGGLLVVAFTITVLLVLFIANRRSSAAKSSLAQSAINMESRDLNDMSCPTGEQYEYSNMDRTRFNSDFSKVLGYPSGGGILMLPLGIAVAEYLGIPRLEIAHRASNQIDEDTFCDRLRFLGAKCWDYEETYMRKLVGFEEMTEMEKAKKEGEIMVGWPGQGKEEEGGVWILRARRTKDYPEETAMLGMCVNMEERCGLLKRWGAIFYGDPREVEEFKGVLGKRI